MDTKFLEGKSFEFLSVQRLFNIETHSEMELKPESSKLERPKSRLAREELISKYGSIFKNKQQILRETIDSNTKKLSSKTESVSDSELYRKFIVSLDEIKVMMGELFLND